MIKTGLVSSIIELRGETLDVRKGKIRRVTIVKGYFETDSSMARHIREDFRLKNGYIVSARGVLGTRCATAPTPLFVHIRHSDLAKRLRSTATTSSFPMPITRKASRFSKRKYRDPFFVIVGDDPAYAEKLFADLPGNIFPASPLPEDLALMSLCSGGVLSNSTFAWWGAFMGKPGGTYVARAIGRAGPGEHGIRPE